MRIIETAQLKPGDYAKSHAAHHIYNGLDCCVTFEVLENLLAELDETTRATYNFSMSLHGPILDMNLRGLRVDEKKKHELMLEYGRELVQMQDNLDRISLEGFGEKINWNSPAQLKKFFYETIGLPPVKKRNSKGEFTPTVNREALEKFRGVDAVKVIVNHILLMRDQAKRLGMLRTGVDADGRFRSSFNIAGTNTGRLSSSYSDFDSGSNLQNIEERLRRIFVADAGYKFANIDLEQADSRNIGALCAKLFGDYTYLNACESGDLHTYVCRLAWPDLPWTGDLKLDRKIADEKFYRDKSRRDVAKVLGHGCLTEEHEVLTRKGWVGISTKPKEIMQWREGRSEFVEVSHWEEHPYTGELQIFEGNSISARMTHDHRVPYKKDKRFKLHEAPAEAGPQAFMPLGEGYVGGAEVVPARLIAALMADGHQETNWMSFHFVKQRKTDRLIKLCELYGYEYRIHGDKIRVKGRLPKYPGAFMFNWTTECLKDFVDELKHWDGSIGATSVTITSTRRQDLEWFQTFGRILGTGGNIGKPVTSGFGSTVYRLQQNNRKWATGGSVRHTRERVNDVMVFCPTVESGWFYTRRGGKIFVTGNTNYCGTPATMSKHSHIDIAVVREFQKVYFRAFPAIERLHRYVERTLYEEGKLTGLLGRRRHFFGRLNDASTIREAVAYLGQNATSDELNSGLVRVWQQAYHAEESMAVPDWTGHVQFLAQVHDSILFQYPEDLEDQIIPAVLNDLVQHIDINGRDFYVPAEAMVGWNWSKRPKDKPELNPDGLIGYKGGDTRTRQNA